MASMGASETSASVEIQSLILEEIRTQRSSIDGVKNTMSEVLLALNDGKHKMEAHAQSIQAQAASHLDLSRTVQGLGTRLNSVEGAIAAAKAAEEAKAAAQRDGSSSWTNHGRHKALTRREHESKPYTISRRMDLGMWIKIGLLIGAILSGYVGAKVGEGQSHQPQAHGAP